MPASRFVFAGRREKRHFSENLAAESQLPIDLISFALGDPHGCGNDTGGNRNTLLLAHVGRVFLSTDDDVIAEPRTLAGEEPPIFSSSGDPTEVIAFEDQDSAKQSTSPLTGCLLDAHEALLGHPLEALRDASTPVQGARVMVTSSGIVGDCGAQFPSFYLWNHIGVERQLCDLDDHRYERVAYSRQILRVVRRPTVTAGTLLMSTHFALDARQLLPPFMPVLRGQDLNFAKVLRLCFDHGFIGHVPVAMPHVPIDKREVLRGSLWPRNRGRAFGVILSACLDGISSAALHSRDTGLARLRACGRQLQELASASPQELSKLVARQLLDQEAGRLRRLHERLMRHEGSTRPWVRDMRSMLEDRVAMLLGSCSLAAYDLSHGRDETAQIQLTQLLISRFGALLEHWPTLFTAAKTLRERGRGLFLE
jgi:hypothetical protein